MTLTLHAHPLASYCHKVMIALYENGTPFELAMVDLSSEAAAAAFRKISPMGKMPALVDAARGTEVWESTAQIEYLAAFYPGAVSFIPPDADSAWRTRMWDRFYDNYVHEPMQRIVADRLRPEDKRDAEAVSQFQAQLRQAYAVVESEMAGRIWAMGDAFTLADCAAAPALFYANILVPAGPGYPAVAAYVERLMRRPAYARVLQEAGPWFRYFPFEGDLRRRYPALRYEHG